MRVALVYPPCCDPTAPYLSVPTLTAWLRRHGVEVLPIDANLEALEALLRREPLEEMAARIARRIARLERKPALSHPDQLVYTQLWRARGDAAAAPAAIEDALAVLGDRSGARFYAASDYEGAIATVDAALRVVSAAHAPLTVDLVAYRTPFSLLSQAEIAHDARPERDPFHDTFGALADRLAAAEVAVVGISMAFPGQLQPGYGLAHTLRQRLPGVHVTAGGPALTQILSRLAGEAATRALGPFHSAVLFEGELALLDLVDGLARGADPTAGGQVIRGRRIEDLGVLPPPDFAGLPLDRYLSPELVLPYDPSRGCYWGGCAFCHYGLTEVGTARYRERPVDTIVDHLDELSRRHDCELFYLSQDVLSPGLAGRMARRIRARGATFRWASDMRPEPALTRERCDELAAGGALAVSLGVESGSPRVLSLIDKGIALGEMGRAIDHLAQADIAVEAMCFSDFPTETCREALDTVAFLDRAADQLGLFILGRFDLAHGSRVARAPNDFGVEEVWQVAGDELGTGLFYREQTARSAEERDQIEAALAELSQRFRLHRYPWAGALSTTHTLLYYRHHGRAVFRRLGPTPPPAVPGARAELCTARFDVVRLAEVAAANEAEIWYQLTHHRRAVGRTAYDRLAAAVAVARPSPRRLRLLAGHEPEPLTRPRPQNP